MPPQSARNVFPFERPPGNPQTSRENVPRPTRGEKISPEQVAKLRILEIEALIKQLNSQDIYSDTEAHAIKSELIKITPADLARRGETISPFPEMLVRAIDHDIDDIWITLGKPKLPEPPQPGQ